MKVFGHLHAHVYFVNIENVCQMFLLVTKFLISMPNFVSLAPVVHCECGNEPSDSTHAGTSMTIGEPVSFSRKTLLPGVTFYTRLY